MSVSTRAAHLTQEVSKNELLMTILSNLWDGDTNPDGFISLGVAENSLMHSRMIDHLHRTMNIPDMAMTYGDGFKRVKAATARFLNKHLKPVTPISPSNLVIANGCTVAIQHLSWSLANPNDVILLGRPYYGAFPGDIGRRTGVEMGAVSFGDLDPLSVESVANYEAEIVRRRDECGQRVAGIILAHPHNPLGRCYSHDALIAFMELCQKHQVHLISDEIYALSVYENRVDKDDTVVPFESILSIDPTGIIDRNLVHVLWGMSKDFGANGLRIGMTITQEDGAVRKALDSLFEFQWTSSLSDLATAEVLEDDAWTDEYIRENQRLLSEHHERVILWARAHDIEYAKGANAGFFVWVNLGEAYRRHHPSESVVDIDKTVMGALLANRIFLADGVRFGAEHPGWFRIIFTQQIDYLDKGLSRIVKALTEGVPN